MSGTVRRGAEMIRSLFLIQPQTLSEQVEPPLVIG